VGVVSAIGLKIKENWQTPTSALPSITRIFAYLLGFFIRGIKARYQVIRNIVDRILIVDKGITVVSNDVGILLLFIVVLQVFFHLPADIRPHILFVFV
jgi:hypothetical protein